VRSVDGHSGGVTPGLIPNPEVKPTSVLRCTVVRKSTGTADRCQPLSSLVSRCAGVFLFYRDFLRWLGLQKRKIRNRSQPFSLARPWLLRRLRRGKTRPRLPFLVNAMSHKVSRDFLDGTKIHWPARSRDCLHSVWLGGGFTDSMSFGSFLQWFSQRLI
jgi:hypothetical protein